VVAVTHQALTQVAVVVLVRLTVLRQQQLSILRLEHTQ